MREIMNLTESRTLPVEVFHGTSDLKWKMPDAGVLYLTINRDDAENYADEAVVADLYDMYGHDYLDDEGNQKPSPSKAIIVTFQMRDLTALGIPFFPDWGWVQQHASSASPTWKQSLAEVGSFCIESFTASMKRLGEVTAAFD